MHVISRKALLDFALNHPDAGEPLDNWFRRTKKAAWENIVDLKRDYPHADLVGRCTVFNIGGNKYRLVGKVHYEKQTVYITLVMTHREYDKGVWRNGCIG